MLSNADSIAVHCSVFQCITVYRIGHTLKTAAKRFLKDSLRIQQDSTGFHKNSLRIVQESSLKFSKSPPKEIRASVSLLNLYQKV